VLFERQLELNKDKEYIPKYDFSLKSSNVKPVNPNQMDTSKLNK